MVGQGSNESGAPEPLRGAFEKSDPSFLICAAGSHHGFARPLLPNSNLAPLVRTALLEHLAIGGKYF